MFKLDLQSRLPIYEQMKRKISELVLTGELKPDDQLPSVRSLARDLGVNPNTVQKAYQDLERDGIIYSVAGRGSYISTSVNLNQQLSQQHLDRVKQSAVQAKNCGIPLDPVLDAVRDVYQTGEGEVKGDD